MNRRRLLSLQAVALVLALTGWAGEARAEAVRWTLAGVDFGWCTDVVNHVNCGYGGTATGYFVADGNRIADWSITLSSPSPSGALPPLNYGVTNSTANPYAVGAGVPFSQWNAISFRATDGSNRGLVLQFTTHPGVPGIVSLQPDQLIGGVIFKYNNEGIYCPGTSSWCVVRSMLSGNANVAGTFVVERLDPTGQLVPGAPPPSCTSLGAASIVDGVAADGVSLLLLRIHGRTQGEVFTLGLPAGAGGEAGWLRELGSSADTSVVTATASCSDNNGGFLAYALYRAPADFAWNTGHQALAQRTVQVITQAPSTTQISIDITVVRPPVVLVHGFSSSSGETWNSFPLFKAPPTTAQGEPLYHVFPVDYGTYLRDEGMLIASLDGKPEPEIGAYDDVKRSHLGLPANWKRVADDARDAIKQFALGNNPTRGPVVVSQADFVAHSMGGLLVRYWALQPDYRASIDHPGQGYAHKLITIGTPHFGSPQATLSLDPDAWCSRKFAETNAGVYSFSTADVRSGFGTYQVPGATATFSGDGVGGYLSVPLELIRSGYGGVPIAALAGDVSSLEFNVDYSLTGLYIRFQCVAKIPFAHDPIARRMNAASFATTFDPTIRPGSVPLGLSRRSDGAVPLTSALMDSSALACAGPNCFVQKAHSAGVGLYFYTSAYFGSPIYLLDSSTPVSLRVLELLNTPVTNTGAWSVR